MSKGKYASLLEQTLLLTFLIVIKTKVGAQDQQIMVQKTEAKNVCQNSGTELPQFSLLAAFTKIAMDQHFSSLCHKELQSIKNEYLARKAWAMKVVDATGSISPGFLLGHNLWLGNRDTCTAAQYPIQLNISPNRFKRHMNYGILNETSPFDVNFKVAYLEFKSPWQVDWKFLPPEKTIMWGLCLPASCSNTEISELLRIYIKNDLFIERKVLDIDATLDHVKTLGLSVHFFKSTSVKLLCGALCFTFLMIVAAICLRLWSKSCTDNGKNDCGKNVTDLNPILSFIKCYDVKDNVTKISCISESKTEINTISAIRAINANLVVSFHVLLFSISTWINRNTLVAFMNRPMTSLVFVIVEAFFIISGFLLTYNFLRNQNQRQLIEEAQITRIPMLFFKKLIHRWLRLAPPYYITVCLSSVVYTLAYQVSVYKLPTRDDLLIADSWWRHLLFTQNFLKQDDFPFIWTWSMACEMQFFLIGTALLFTYARHQWLAKLLYIMLVLGSVITYFHNGVRANFMWHYDSAFDSISEMYLHTSVRIISYFVGMLVAWYIVEKPCILHPKLEWAIGNLSIVLFVVLISPLTDNLTEACVMSIVILLLLRVLLSIWICWLILAGLTRRRIWLSPILEFKLFQPIGRLSYGIYLLNPIIVTTIVCFTHMGFFFDWTLLILLVVGTIIMTKWAAVLFSLAFELPYCNLSSLLLKPKMKKV